MKAPFPAPTNEWHNASYASINPSRPELSVKGKKIIVTGGGYGIGRETTKAFAIAGATGIAIIGRKEAPLLDTKKFIESEYSVPVSIHVADITDASAMRKAASEIGEWDVLVMNAGYMATPGTTLGSDIDEWWKAFEVFVPLIEGYFECSNTARLILRVPSSQFRLCCPRGEKIQ